VRRRIGTGQIESVPDRAHYDLRYWISIAKARRELDWEAASDLDVTIESTVSWYLSNREWLNSANRRLAALS
jgi:dTDP-D-glucose 4,6-dehydratase